MTESTLKLSWSYIVAEFWNLGKFDDLITTHWSIDQFWSVLRCCCQWPAMIHVNHISNGECSTPNVENTKRNYVKDVILIRNSKLNYLDLMNIHETEHPGVNIQFWRLSSSKSGRRRDFYTKHQYWLLTFEFCQIHKSVLKCHRN